MENRNGIHICPNRNFNLCLEPVVLDINMAYWADIFAQDPRRDTAAMRHAAYRQFVLWRHGRIGQGVRRVIPSCVVWMIRERFPNVSGQYTGFQVSRLAWVTLLFCHATVVPPDKFSGWRRTWWCQCFLNTPRIIWQHPNVSTDRFLVCHSPLYNLCLHLDNVVICLGDFHWHSVPVGGLLAVHPPVPVTCIYNW